MLLALLAPLAWERVRAERLKNLWKIACIAVQAAEQRGGSGAQKRAYAQALLRDRYPESLEERYKVTVSPNQPGWELLEQCARKRGMLISGGEADTGRMARVLLDEFRGGKLGRFTLEAPEGVGDHGAD